VWTSKTAASSAIKNIVTTEKYLNALRRDELQYKVNASTLAAML
jgi:hypothetical protein